MTKNEAIELYDSKWWLAKNSYEIAKFQLFEEKLCIDFSLFHKALEEVLNRSVFIYELGINYDSICKEFLRKTRYEMNRDVV